MFRALKRWLVGSPLPTAQAVHERLSKTIALAVFSSDALSSVAYASQEILHYLLLAGPAGFVWCMPLSGGIAALLVIVAASYSQTIRAYPGGGGSYRVAKDNLGTLPGLTAAAAILIGYILTVAVSTAAGVAAITSAVPALYEHRIVLCVLSVVVVSVLNLRGVRESGRIFAVPTYLFIAAFALLLIGAFARMAGGRLPSVEHPPEAGAALLAASQPLTLWLLLRSYAAGCTALTGIEAIADGVPAFRPPESRNAAITLAWMAAILCTFFLGTSLLATRMGALPLEQETVISQIARTVFGPGLLYYTVQVCTAMILLLAANTAFADFPRLSSFLARDRFVPRQFANRGDRLVFSNGIVFLAATSIALLIFFQGSVHALLPLYAIGVFLAFTLSQAGMVMRHRRLREGAWRRGIAFNGLGALTTFSVCLIIGVTRFTEGAWVVILVIPVFVALFYRVHSHYMQLRDQLSLTVPPSEVPVRNTVIVPVAGLHRGVVQALQYARALSEDVRAVMIDLDPDQTRRVREAWPKHGCGVPLIVLDSPYRSIVRPLLEYIESVDRRSTEDVLTVILPEFVPARWWEHLLHNQTALLIKGALLFRRGTIVTSVPYHLHRAPNGPEAPPPAGSGRGGGPPAAR